MLLKGEPAIDLAELEAPPDKVVAETAFLLRAAASIPEAAAPGVAGRVSLLADRLVPHARGARARVAIALAPATARDYAVAHVTLGATGRPDPEFELLLARSLADPTSAARERLPHRELEQAWVDHLRGGGPVPAELVSRTALARGVDLLLGSRDDVYALTHSLMYATDFGAFATPLPRSAAAVLAESDSALAGALDADDFDLAGELLMSRPFLGPAWSAVPSFAFRVLARIEDEVGVLPSLAIDGDGYRRQPSASRREYYAATTYHTAYVMGLLCALLLAGDSRPLTGLGSSGGADAADQVLKLLRGDAHAAEWEGDLELLPADERAALTSFLVDVAVRRAVRRFDFEAARQAVAIGVRHRVAPSPLVAQAARLLRRLAHGFAASELSVG